MTVLRYAVSEEVRHALGDFLDVLDLHGEQGEPTPESILNSQLWADTSSSQLEPGEAIMMVYARLFDSGDRASVLEVFERADRFFATHPRSFGAIEVVLLSRGLFDGYPSNSAGTKDVSDAGLDEIEDYLTRHAASASDLDIRVWLIDARAQNGTIYRMSDVASLLRLCTPLDLAQALPQGAGNYCTFGGRVAVFPRSRIQAHLADHYSIRVMMHEDRWLRGAMVPFASVGKECAEFLRETCVPLIDTMDKDSDGNPLSEAPEMPSVQVQEPLEIVQGRIESAVDTLTARLDAVEARIAENYETVVDEIQEALRRRITTYADIGPSRTIMARAFMDALEHGVTSLASGSQSSWSGQKMLRDAYAPSTEFLDEVTGFDSTKREQLRVLTEDVESLTAQIARLRDDLEHTERQSEGEASSRAQTLRRTLEQAQRDLTEKEQARDALEGEVYAQDLALDPTINSRALRASLARDTQTKLDGALGALRKSADKMETVRGELASAESEMQSVISNIVLRLLLAALVLFAIGAAGLFAMPLLFGAVPVVGAPLFGFVGTVVGAMWVRVWGVFSVVAFVGMLVAHLSTYSKHKRILDEKQAELDSAEGAHRAALREYWEASAARFTRACDLAKHLSVLGLESALRDLFEDERQLLLRFDQAMRGVRDECLARVDSFSLESTVTEFVVVGGDYAERLIERQADTLDKVSTNFFSSRSAGESPVARRMVSDYLRLFRETGRLERLTEDLCEDCAAEVSWELSRSNVVEAARELDPELSGLGGALSSLTVLLSLDGHERDKDLTMVLSPDKSEFDGPLAPSGVFGSPPVIIEHEDPERIVMFRIVHDIKREDIAAL